MGTFTKTKENTMSETIFESTTSNSSMRHTQQLRKDHEADPFVAHTVQTGTKLTMTKMEHDGEVVVLREHSRQVLTISTEGEVYEQPVWIGREMFRRDEIGRIVCVTLHTDGDLGLTPNERYQPVLLATPQFGLPGFAREQSGLLTDAMGRNVTSLTAAGKTYRHYEPASTDWRDKRTDQVITDHLAPYFFQTKTAAEVVAKMFGAGNVRADLVKEVAQAKLRPLYFATWFYSDDMPVDWIVDLLRELRADPSLSSWYESHWYTDSAERAIVAALDTPSRHKLMRKLATKGADQNLHDAANNYMRIAPFMHTRYAAPQDVALPSRCSTWADLEHKVNRACQRAAQVREDERLAARQADEDRRKLWLSTEAGQTWLSKQNAEKQRQAALDVKRNKARMAKLEEQDRVVFVTYNQIKDGIEDLTFDNGLSFVVATGQHQLTEWGRISGNCIAGYSVNVTRTHTMLFGVYRTNQLVANVEVKIDSRTGRAHFVQIQGNYRLLGRLQQSSIVDEVEATLGSVVREVNAGLSKAAA